MILLLHSVIIGRIYFLLIFIPNTDGLGDGVYVSVTIGWGDGHFGSGLTPAHKHEKVQRKKK